MTIQEANEVFKKHFSPQYIQKVHKKHNITGGEADTIREARLHSKMLRDLSLNLLQANEIQELNNAADAFDLQAKELEKWN